ncbi:high affinity cationic amino acid transporter 1-like isoform X1, partial [Brachionus plicatilis]
MKFNFQFFYRKKKFDQNSLESTNLSRVLDLFDLTALGVSSTIGSGVYVLIGNTISHYAGPSIIISFIIAGICSFLAGLCYAELGSRVPRSGSAYVYIYVTIGEFIAFIIGWDVVLEYVIGTSTSASALSKYIDSLTDYQISTALNNSMHMNVHFLAPYPDFLAFGMAVIITGLLTIGVKESSFVNKIFTAGNVACIFFVIFCGSSQADLKNWSKKVYPNMSYTDIGGRNLTCKESNVCGNGGFVPFGFNGIIKGAAKCFYAYIGFDVIATTGEEVMRPKRTIPISILLTLLIVSVCYIGVSVVVSLMVPYYVFDKSAPLSEIFNYVGLEWAYYVVTTGAIISLATGLYASMFPMPRVVYSMATDGLLFQFLSFLTPKLNTPLWASLMTGFLAGLLVLLFDLNQLIDMMSIGTLIAYSLVSACCLSLRYKPNVHEDLVSKPQQFRAKILSLIFGYSPEPVYKRLFVPSETKPSRATSHLANTIIFLSMIVIVIIGVILNQADLQMAVSIVFLIIFFIILIVLSFILWRQPQDDTITTFKVPFVPFFPLLSAFVNIYLMTSLTAATWIRFIVWFLIGILIYFTYSIRYSKENKIGSHILFPCFHKSYNPMDDTEEIVRDE